MRPHLYKRRGYWKVRSTHPEITFTFASFEGAFRWAKRIAD